MLNLQLRHNEVVLPHLPEIFDGYTLLQLSDLHLDSLDAFPEVLAEKISELEFDICVLTGDYRFLTHGPHHNAMLGLERLRRDITADMYAILGNHDPVAMVPPIEAMGIRLLLNENIPLQRNGERLWLAGIDDPTTSARITWKRPMMAYPTRRCPCCWPTPRKSTGTPPM